MDGINSNQRNNPLTNQPWLAKDVFALPGVILPLPKHHEKFVRNSDPEKKDSTEDHIKKFILAIRLMNVEHEDVMCILFPYTFEGKASTLYFSFNTIFNNQLE